MFGGLAFMLGGHMFCGVVKDTLMVRLGPDGARRALDRPHVRPMDFTGRPMKGMVFVEAAGLRGERCGSGSMPPPATPAACRSRKPHRPPGSAGDVSAGSCGGGPARTATRLAGAQAGRTLRHPGHILDCLV